MTKVGSTAQSFRGEGKREGGGQGEGEEEGGGQGGGEGGRTGGRRGLRWVLSSDRIEDNCPAATTSRESVWEAVISRRKITSGRERVRSNKIRSRGPLGQYFLSIERVSLTALTTFWIQGQEIACL